MIRGPGPRPARDARWTAALAAALIVLIALAATATAATPPHSARQIQRLIVEEADLTSVPPSLALALAKVESDFRSDARSRVGARGVMQIMPRTARDEYGVDPDELWDPRLNVQIGIHFLEGLIERYGGRWDLALSHYNGGSLQRTGAAARPHGYTRRYVAQVLDLEKRYAREMAVWRDDDTAPVLAWHPARTRVGPTATVARHAHTERARDWVMVRATPAAPAPRSGRVEQLARHLPTAENPGTLDDFASGHIARVLSARHGGQRSLAGEPGPEG